MANCAYLDRLNDKQREAVLQTEGPLLVLAGAGSGKTSMMTSRIAYLIQEKGVSPYNILAVTFTNKAAQEMRERVESILNAEGMFGINTRGMWIQTFHSACLRILRSNYEEIGYGKDFIIYDTTDQKTVIKQIIKDLNVDDKQYPTQYFSSIISDNKNQGISPDMFLKYNPDNPKTTMIYNVYEAYQSTLKKNNAMDFDDLLINAVKVLERSEEALLKYQRIFRYIMVDEYQDTNYIQYKLIKMIAEAHNNICVVGDDDQCIYQWRGADIRNILNFEKDFPGTRLIKLEQNYRSCACILEAANGVIANNKTRKEKALWTNKDKGDLITYFRADNEREEAEFVAQEIRHRIRGREYGDFAVLYRTNAQSRVFEEVLRRNGIPAKVVGNVGFYERKEIKDVLAYLRLVENPSDDMSLERIINEPKRGVGEKTLDKIKAYAKIYEKSLLAALKDEEVLDSLSVKVKTAVSAMAELLWQYHDEKDNLILLDIYDGILAKSGYLKVLEEQNTVEAEGRIENIMELRSAIEQFQKENPNGTIGEFLEGKALASDADKLPEAEENGEVLLMTLHTAKGLEFPVVFLPGMEEGLFPSKRSMDTETGIEEERRLCYVGITRAKEKLFMLSARTRMLYGRTDYTSESCFIKEINPKLLNGDVPDCHRERKTIRDGYSQATPPPKPFDSLKYAKQDVMKKSADASSSLSFEVGDRVSHVKFGQGTVLETDEKTVVVDFDSEGRKKLAKGIAPLEKL